MNPIADCQAACPKGNGTEADNAAYQTCYTDCIELGEIDTTTTETEAETTTTETDSEQTTDSDATTAESKLRMRREHETRC